ncbi:hypothetical protein VP01_344g9 [Puccinia sorghi]|uniref:Uncharacterized protein n=1 Tax=Puccinia sorghi TaxID=27349 RepID=A0A0L6UY33_9BASI|nr:hypothetical protein VP01_344g9 [Puccinia sorghi]
MVRRSSPLAQSTQPSPANHLPAPSEKDQTHRHPNTPTITSASYRNSSASTVTITSASTPTVPGSITLVPVLHPDDEADEDSDTTSDVDHRPPGHRSTPGTSVDSSTSNFPLPEDSSAASNKTNTAALPDRTHHKHSRHTLTNKLRRALNINALQENIMHDSIPELHPVVTHERLHSSSASIAGVPSSPSITNTGKSGRQPRRFGFLNSKSNSSTDNLSISSTVSSASVMIRKLGNLGKSARSKGVMSLTKIFKDKNDLAAAGESDTDGNKGCSTKPNKKGSAMNQQKNPASISVAQVQAEVDRSLSVEFPGMTPAAAFIHKQKQQYAQQEAAAAAAAAASAATAAAITSASEPLSQTHSSESVKSKSRAGSIGSSGSLTPGTALEARKKMIEKEKEKIKSKKSRKWGFGTGGSISASDDLPASTCVEHPRRSSEHASDAEEAEDWDDNTVRNANVEGLIDPYAGAPRRSVEELRNGNDDDDVDDNEGIDEYDMESLYSSNDGTSSARRSGLKPRPSREAVPKKGILKNAQNFSQERHLSPTLSQPAKPLSGSTTPDRLQPGKVPEESIGLLQLAKQSERPDSVIDFGSQLPNLTLSIAGAEVRDRRATFAQHLSVHTTWPPAIYDRRGELATCNRLTPTLAQRIKEEINAFKMEEMDVHYASRVHTHFFVVSHSFYLSLNSRQLKRKRLFRFGGGGSDILE